MRIIVFFLLIVAFGEVKAQQAEPLLFREKIHDFGELYEMGGVAQYDFTFTNNAGRPIRILSVQASCGCTTPDWSKEPIAQGKTGFIKVSFDPIGKPGFFNKTLTVATDLDANSIILQIKGQVVAAAKSPEVMFPAENGSLRLKANSFNLGKVFINRETSAVEFDIYNSSAKAIHFSKSISPAYVVVTTPDSIASKSKGKIKLSYNGKMKNQYGFVSDNIELITDDEENPRKPFSVYATIEEYFAPLSVEEADKAPVLLLELSEVDLGRTKAGNSLSKSIRIKNQGKKDLLIHTIQSNCTCVVVQSPKTKLKSGEETELQITLNGQGRTGTLQKALTIYSNDPRNPVQRITLTAYIEE